MRELKKIWKFLDGKKTVISAVVGAVMPWAIGQGWIDPETAGMVTAVLAAVGLGHKAVKVKAEE